MQDRLITAIALAIAGVVAYLCRNLNWGSVVKKRRFIEKAASGGYCTVGVYDSSKVIRGIRESGNSVERSDAVKVKYRYEVNGITYYKQLTFLKEGRISVDSPLEIKVYYNPRNPKKAVCPEEATKAMQVRSGCMTTMVIFVLALICVRYLLRILFGVVPLG